MYKNLFSPFLVFLFGVNLLNAQPTEVNKYILAPFGTPVSDIDWGATKQDGSGNLITVGNTIVSSDVVALLISKQASTGTQTWQASFQPPSAPISKSYGIALTTDASNNIYVAGVTKIGTGSFDYLILKYSSIGVLLWSKIIDGNSLERVREF